MRVAVIVSTAALFSAPLLGAQETPRDSAFTLFDRGEHRAAYALFERLVLAGSTDPTIHGRYGNLLLEFSGASVDSAERRLMRVKGRDALLRAIRLGSTDPQIRAMAEAIPEDGGTDAVFSESPKVQDAMRRAEAAYSSRDMTQARAAYLEALALDPALYIAAVFVGDTYIESGPIDSAYAWYRRATEIDPDQETAWRYWADILLKHDQVDAARERAVEALVAEPYAAMPRQILTQWARRANRSLGLPRLSLPSGDSATAARAAYDTVRASWRDVEGRRSTAFSAAYPSEPAYRHSLAEEVAALRAAGAAGGDDPRTRSIATLDSLGLLEPFVLIAGADAGVAQDYPAYRASHREALRRFWQEVVIGAPMNR